MNGHPTTPGTDEDATLDLSAPLLVGFGVVGRAVAAALQARGHRSTVVEDRPRPELRPVAQELGVTLIEAPDQTALAEAVSAASLLLPSPGVPDHHPVFSLARARRLTVASEFDLAQRWDQRPVVAITGTNGKTTVTTMVAAALERSGIAAAGVGNTETPYVEAIADRSIDAFVVEASSFRLAHSLRFRPAVAAWLNFAPDHLDAHADLASYESAKASVWSHLEPGAVVVANADDPVVWRRAQELRRPVCSFSIAGLGSAGAAAASEADWRVESGDGGPVMWGPGGPLMPVGELGRRQPHDVANALATAAITLAAGGNVEGLRGALRDFVGLPHRLERLGCWGEVAWFNDSKATVPQATAAAVGGFSSVVLIAGGSGKGLSFEPLSETIPPVRAVVAIGDAAAEVAAVFEGSVPVRTVRDGMAQAVEVAAELARPGDAVILSPACASFDWYTNYVERGLDFSKLVRARFAGAAQTDEVR